MEDGARTVVNYHKNNADYVDYVHYLIRKSKQDKKKEYDTWTIVNYHKGNVRHVPYLIKKSLLNNDTGIIKPTLEGLPQVINQIIMTYLDSDSLSTLFEISPPIYSLMKKINFRFLVPSSPIIHIKWKVFLKYKCYNCDHMCLKEDNVCSKCSVLFSNICGKRCKCKKCEILMDKRLNTYDDYHYWRYCGIYNEDDCKICYDCQGCECDCEC